MKAIRLHAHGGPENIFLDDIDEPGASTAHRIKVDVQAMALNHMDIWVRDGLPGIEQEMPFIMGCDASGVVAEIGPGVEGFRVGDRVVLTPMVFCGRCEACLAGEQSQCPSFQMRGEHLPGHFAERVIVKSNAVRKIGDSVSFQNAAAFCLTFLTAWRMMMTKARVKPGETVLIHGIGGGVSLAALSICRLIGARAFVTSGEDWKLERAKELGAFGGCNYKKEDAAKAVFKATDKRGADVVIDSVGGPTWSASVKAARPGGRIVTCGVTAGGNPPADLTRIFWKQLHIMGSTMGSMSDFTESVNLLNQGKLTPVIDKVYPADAIREAHARLTAAEQFGKVVLTF